MIDEGISGTSLNKRLGFQEMIEDCKQGKIDLILTKSISRFGRNIVDMLTTLRLLSDLTPPVAVMFETEGINTADSSNKLIISVLSALAEMESQVKSEAIKRGIVYRMQAGVYKFSVENLLGYYRDYTGRIKIEETEAEIVRYIYDRFLEGNSPKDIADSLTAQGISSPKGMSYWRSNTIRSILSNEKYCGDVLYQKSYSKDYLSHKTVKNKGVLPQWHWEDSHPAIIKKTKWTQAQELLKAKNWIHKKEIKDLPKKFTVSRVKSGNLRGFIYIDMAWSSWEREKFFEYIDSI